MQHQAISLSRSDHAISTASAIAAGALRECHDCGCFQTVPAVAPGVVAHCLRCDGVLRRGKSDPLLPTLVLAGTGLVLLAVALVTPFLRIRMLGRGAETQFTSGALALDQYGLWGLALVVFVTTVFAPLAKLVCTAVVLGGLHMQAPPRRLYLLFRGVDGLRPWAMIEVYMLGIFVAYTKLVQMAHIDIGIAAYAVAALMFVMVAADATLDPEAVWERLEARRLVADPAWLDQPRIGTGKLIGCTGCGRVHDGPDGSACPRCGKTLRARKPDSLRRTASLVLAAAILYIPANLFPVMTLVSLGRGQTNTILSGVKELASSGMWPLAVLVFFASITVPVLKIVGLTLMMVSVRRGWRRHLRDRTTLYRLVDFVGRWSMIDVFMISILVGLVHFGFIANVAPEVGAVAFAAVVILTMLAAMTFDPRLMWDADRRSPNRRA